jgi:hypothetical protein
MSDLRIIVAATLTQSQKRNGSRKTSVSFVDARQVLPHRYDITETNQVRSPR